MKFKKIAYFAAGLLMAAGATACEDAIDLSPKSQIGLDEYFKSANDLQVFSNYFYPAVLTQNMDGDPAYDDQADDLVAIPMSPLLRGGNTRSVPASGGGWSWSALRRINTLLEYIDRCPDRDAVERYTAVARFFRAYFYFQKVARFGDVPWIDRQLGSADEQLYAPRDSRELVMTKMLEDIDYAIEHLPTNKTEKSPYIVTRGAALALKSNFCLFEGTFRKYHGLELDGHDWRYYLQQCADASRQLMSGEHGSYKVYTTGKPTEDYMNLFNAQDANTAEYILAVKYDQALGIKHNANAFTLQPTQGRPGYTRKFICTYLMKDGSRFTDRAGWQTMQFVDEMADRDPRLQQTVRGLGYHRKGDTKILAADLTLSSTGYQPIKFVTESKMGSYAMDLNNTTSCDLPEFRYAETLLNLAEALAELGTLTQQDLDLTVNVLRKRVGMPSLDMAAANAKPDPYLMSDVTGFGSLSDANAGVILEIRRERGIEMAQEGRRWRDLMRWRTGRMVDQSLGGIYFAGPGSYDLTGDGKPNVILYASGTVKPNNPNGEVLLEIGKDIRLTDGNRGYLDGTFNQTRQGFREDRDYLFPIPSDDINLNPNLKQNPNG